MSNRKKIVKLFHVRYVADFLVPAISSREAFDLADEQMVEMVEGDQYELDDIFNITIENDRFHVVEDVPDDEDVDDSADDNEDVDDDGDDNGDDAEDDAGDDDE